MTDTQRIAELQSQVADLTRMNGDLLLVIEGARRNTISDLAQFNKVYGLPKRDERPQVPDVGRCMESLV